MSLRRFEEAKALLRKTVPVARRVLGDCNELTIMMRMNYAEALYGPTGARPDDLREAVATLEGLETTARRVLGGAHPVVLDIGGSLGTARAALRARDTPSTRA